MYMIMADLKRFSFLSACCSITQQTQNIFITFVIQMFRVYCEGHEKARKQYIVDYVRHLCHKGYLGICPSHSHPEIKMDLPQLCSSSPSGQCHCPSHTYRVGIQ